MSGRVYGERGKRNEEKAGERKHLKHQTDRAVRRLLAAGVPTFGECA